MLFYFTIHRSAMPFLHMILTYTEWKLNFYVIILRLYLVYLLFCFTAPVFYNFGNYSWEEARQYCQQLISILTDTFALFTQPVSLEFNTLYWIGTFRVENYYWGYGESYFRNVIRSCSYYDYVCKLNDLAVIRTP